MTASPAAGFDHSPAAKAGGPESTNTPPDGAFRARYGNSIGAMGIGHYAGQDAFEFVAEAIAWRLHAEYGAKPEAPRMPRHLENWVHDRRGLVPFRLKGGKAADRLIS